jgi:hypothetical protein
MVPKWCFGRRAFVVRIKKRKATQRLVGEWKTKVFYQFYNDEYQGRSAGMVFFWSIIQTIPL